jgi:8-oxo-dGTP diphosphatase
VSRPPVPFLVVCAGLIFREDGALLIARRPPHAWMPGYWEFPGGKIEDGETPEACLAREIREELSIEAEVGRIFHVKIHEYPDRRVLLLFYRCRIASGEPPGPARGGLAFAWAKPFELFSFEMLPADAEVIKLLLTAP